MRDELPTADYKNLQIDNEKLREALEQAKRYIDGLEETLKDYRLALAAARGEWEKVFNVVLK